MKKEEVIEKLIEQVGKSKIVAWELENFAQYEKARFEFDESGIIMLKGFNSAGKSNALRALRYALTTEKMGNGKLKRYIRHGCLEASVTIFMSDGSEIKYIMQLSSTSPRARFTNGYHWYLNHGGKRYELFSTKVDGKYVPQRTTPGVLERYFNLTAVDKGYLNILKKADGMLLTEQTPKAINKALSKATQMETVDRAIKKVQDNNKILLEGMKKEEMLVGVLTEQIKRASVVTKGMINTLRLLDEGVESAESTISTLTLVSSRLESLGKMEKPITLDKVGMTKITALFDMLSSIERLSNVSDSISCENIPLDTYKALLGVLNALEGLNKLKGIDTQVEKIEMGALSKLQELSVALQKQQELEKEDIPKLEEIKTVDLKTLVNLKSSIIKYNKFLKTEDECIGEIDRLKGDANNIVLELKELGYPVIRCSHCGELAVALDFELGKGGSCNHVNN